LSSKVLAKTLIANRNPSVL